MIIVTSVIKNNKRMPNSPSKSDYEIGYSDAVNKVIDILSTDPAYKETIEFIVWKLKL